MATQIVQPSPSFDGVEEKLKRTDENIVNLHNEITAFFDGCKYPVVPNPDSKDWQEAVNYHRALKIPKRFSVLSGEVVHHLRSCLDHIVWHFSSAEARRDHASALEFPIYAEPLTKDSARGYERKIQGITSVRVRELISQLQPYPLFCICTKLYDGISSVNTIDSGKTFSFRIPMSV